jgi:hypothetical protein
VSVFLLAGAFVVAAARASDCATPIVAVPAGVSCGHSRSGQRLFTCAEREHTLRAAGIAYDELDALFPETLEEHAMVRVALDRTLAAPLADGRARAMLWEELVARIDRRLERPVSKSFRGVVDGGDVFVFQGMRRFEGRAYLLVIEPSGAVYSGLVAPLEDLGHWEVRRESLTRRGG